MHFLPWSIYSIPFFIDLGNVALFPAFCTFLQAPVDDEGNRVKRMIPAESTDNLLGNVAINWPYCKTYHIYFPFNQSQTNCFAVIGQQATHQQQLSQSATSEKPASQTRILQYVIQLILRMTSLSWTISIYFFNRQLISEYPNSTALIAKFDRLAALLQAPILQPLPRINSRDRGSIASLGGITGCAKGQKRWGIAV